MRKKRDIDQVGMTAAGAIEQMEGASRIFAMAVVDEINEEASYAFAGPPDLLLQLIPALERHVRQSFEQ